MCAKLHGALDTINIPCGVIEKCIVLHGIDQSRLITVSLIQKRVVLGNG